MRNQCSVRVEPFGALGAVVSAESRKVLSGLGLHELLEVLGREEVGLDLVDVSGLAPGLGDGSLVGDAHGCGFIRDGAVRQRCSVCRPDLATGISLIDNLGGGGWRFRKKSKILVGRQCLQCFYHGPYAGSPSHTTATQPHSHSCKLSMS